MKSNRRTFVLGALSLPFASVATPLMGRTATVRPDRALLLVSDIGVPVGAQFLEGWSAVAAETLGFNGNISALLIERLVPKWRREGVSPIAGLTDARAFFCLSHMAGDHGLRLAYRSVRARSEGEARESRRVHEGQTDWLSRSTREMAQALGSSQRRQALPIPELLPDESVLVSWLMLPRAQVVA